LIDLNAIMMFSKVVETESFSQAARVMGIPKSTISRKISQMEDDLGVRLLQRNTRQLRLTEVGRDVYERSLAIVQEVRTIQASAESTREEVSGNLRVVLPIAFNSASVASLCSEFLKTYPKVNLEIQFSDSEVDIIGEEFDIAVKFGPLPNSNLIARLLFELPLVLVASPSYIKAYGKPNSISCLESHHVLMLSNSRSAPIWPLGSGESRRLVRVKPRAWANSSVAIKQMTKEGLGISLMTKSQCAQELKRGELVKLLPELAIEPIKAYGLYSSRLQLAPKNSRFLEYFAKNFIKQSPDFSLQLSPVKGVVPIK